MSTKDPNQGLRNFYKFFTVFNFFFFLFFLFLLSGCSFKILDLNLIVKNLNCAMFLVLVIFSFVFGLLSTLVGIQHAQRVHKSSALFYLMLCGYLAGIVIFIIN